MGNTFSPDLSQVAKIVDFCDATKAPAAAVIIIAYNTDRKLLAESLDSLCRQTHDNFEVLFVDNSDRGKLRDVVSRYPVKYIEIDGNCGVTGGRNIAVHYTQAPILIFLDDDALTANDFVAQHLKAFEDHDIIALRGKICPRTESIYNRISPVEDMGDEVFTWLLDKEGNTSFKREVFIEAGGYCRDLPNGGGHEGVELTYRILHTLNYDRDQIIYYPPAVIYHNFYENHRRYFRKIIRHEKARELLNAGFPQLLEFQHEYLRSVKLKTYKPTGLIDRIRLDVVRRITRYLKR